MYKDKNFSINNEWNKDKTVFKEKDKCHKCSSFDHIRIECPNFKRRKGKLLNDDSDFERSSTYSKNETDFIVFSASVNECVDNDKQYVVDNADNSKIDGDDNDSNTATEITDHELSLQEAYDDLCEEVMKIKKLNKKLYRNLTTLENEKNRLVEALKLLEIEVSRLHCQQEVLEKELITCQKVKKNTATQKLNELLKVQRDSSDHTGLGYKISKSLNQNASTASSSKGISPL